MTPLPRAEIENLIPHRGDSLLLDGVVAWEKSAFLEGRYAIRPDHPMLGGHFPANPIWPGVLSLEGLAQAAAALTSLSHGVTANDVLYLFAGTEEVRFFAPVVPPSTITYHVKQLRERLGLLKFEGEVKAGKEVVVKAVFHAKMIRKEG